MWPFKKKRDEIVISPQVSILNDNLRVSFSRIKSDIQIVRDWISSIRDKEFDQDSKIKEIESKLEGLDDVLPYIQRSQMRLREELLEEIGKLKNQAPSSQYTPLKKEIPELIAPQYNPEIQETPINPQITTSNDILDTLTETQRIILLRLVTLVKESGQDWVTIKNLAQDLYPNKEYSQIRSTLSEYIGVLVDNNLVKKQRRGKQTYVSLTERAGLLKGEKKAVRKVINAK